jgi:hypothetical protein
MVLPEKTLITTALVVASVLLSQPGSGQLDPSTDLEIERCLEQGKIIRKTDTLVGVTRPDQLELECDGETHVAVFKIIDEHRRGVTRFNRGGAEMNYSDSFKYERVAYLLDRELGLNMTPVAVIRDYKGDEGAMIDWIHGASLQKEMTQTPTGTQMAELARQKAMMRVFDALILNVDRRPENWLIDDEDWSLYLIDHGRAFRTQKQLPEAYVEKKSRISPELYEKLQALDEDQLVELFEGLISNAQIKALLDRRDQIVEKIEEDLTTYGEAVVFSG